MNTPLSTLLAGVGWLALILVIALLIAVVTGALIRANGNTYRSPRRPRRPCQHCGNTANRPDAVFCKNCGVRLRARPTGYRTATRIW